MQLGVSVFPSVCFHSCLLNNAIGLTSIENSCSSYYAHQCNVPIYLFSSARPFACRNVRLKKVIFIILYQAYRIFAITLLATERPELATRHNNLASHTLCQAVT